MYEQFFGLNELPFALTPDTGFVYRHAGHQEAINDLLTGLQTGEGFMAVIAEVGSGKTLLCRKLLSLLPDNWASAYLPNPLLSPVELYSSIARELGLQTLDTGSLEELQQRIFECLICVHEEKGQTVILIDEAQAMSQRSLEALRLLSNLETEKQKLLQVVFFAQPEFKVRLSQHAFRQLRQRITCVCDLKPISRSEVEGYLRHRMQTAGYNGPPTFSAKAVRKIVRHSGGRPRVINILAHKALLAAFGKGKQRVMGREVETAVVDTSLDVPSGILRAGYSRFFVGFISSLFLALIIIFILKELG